jgi:hypothetical protein
MPLGTYISVASNADGGTPRIVSELNPLPVTDFWLRHAINVIKQTYDHDVSVQEKGKDLIKFGRSTQVQTTDTTIMTLPSGVYNETYLATNGITTISSASSGDTFSATIEGHTIDGNGDFTFVSQSVTLNGQTAVSLSTPLARATRLYNTGAVNSVGPVYVYESTAIVAGVPTDGTKVHLMLRAGKNQSEKCATTLSQYDYWIITNINGQPLKKTQAAAEYAFQVREKGGVFRTQLNFAASNTNEGGHTYKPYHIIRPNSDIRMVANADTSNTDCFAHIAGVLAIIT